MCTRGAQWYEWYTQFLQVGRNNDRALILIGLTLYLPSASVSSVFMVLTNSYVGTSFTYLLVRAWWNWLLIWLTNHCPLVLTVGWVI